MPKKRLLFGKLERSEKTKRHQDLNVALGKCQVWKCKRKPSKTSKRLCEVHRKQQLKYQRKRGEKMKNQRGAVAIAAVVFLVVAGFVISALTIGHLGQAYHDRNTNQTSR